MTSVPDGDAQAAYHAQPRPDTGEAQQSVLQSVLAMPSRILAAGSDYGAIQFHSVDEDLVSLTHILHACS